ncbi:MAG: L-aspartate oxidase [Clostridium sp.]|nr:L-aspartate oxidase [Clostridium sp.]
MDIYTDVLVVGSGVAGMFAALNIDKKYKVTVISKTKSSECNTYLAQGGISKARDKDDIDLFVQDTIKAGQGKNKSEAVRVLAEESIYNIKMLEKFGMKFDKNGNDFDYTREGAHSVNRIVHSDDVTGKRVFETLYSELKKRENITLEEDIELVDILKYEGICVGAVVIKDNSVNYIHSKFVVLASGGIGGLFVNSTNRRALTGDGIAIAMRNKIAVKNLNYIQFHPTALYEKDVEDRRFLISESMRGEGAKLINKYGKRFVNELLPRDVVANRIWEEEKDTDSKFVTLDLSSMTREFIVKRFPGIYEGCLERGIDITKSKIPVTPVQHYFMGGIDVDLYSKTSMDNLYACGEVSCTGVHGANRLASNSLLEGLVFSRRAALDINSKIENTSIVKLKKSISLEEAENIKKLNRKCVTEEFKKVLGGKKNELTCCR